MNTEDLVIAYTKLFEGKELDDRYATSLVNLIKHGRKLMAEHDPQIMPLEERTKRLIQAAYSPYIGHTINELKKDRESIAAALDKGLADENFHPEGKARRTVARLLKNE